MSLFGLDDEILEDVDLEDADELDADIAELEAEFEADEEEYGWYGAEHGPESAPLAYVPVVSASPVAIAALSEAFRPEQIPDVVYEYVFPDWASSMTIEGEANDLANNLAKTKGFGSWPGLNPDEKMEVLGAAIGGSILFNQPDAYYVLEDAWDRGDGAFGTIEEVAKAGPQAIATWFKKDVWETLKALFPGTDEQNFNTLAFIYWYGHKAGWLYGHIPLIGDTIADFLDRYDKIAAQVDAVWAAGEIAPAAPTVEVDVEEEVWDVETVAPPKGVSLPRPQTVLAIGYGLMTLTAGARAAGWMR